MNEFDSTRVLAHHVLRNYSNNTSNAPRLARLPITPCFVVAGAVQGAGQFRGRGGATQGRGNSGAGQLRALGSGQGWVRSEVYA